MSVRLWRKNGPMISVEGRKGYFDVAYGQDSPSQKLDVFLPEGQGPFPAIISIHGGGYVACDKRQKEMIEPMLAGLKRGFAVIGLNYRLAGKPVSGTGRDIKRAVRFIKANAREWDICPDGWPRGAEAQEDMMTLMGCLCAQDRYFDSGSDPYREVDAGLAAGVIPYVPGDLIKIAAALAVGPVLRKAVRRAA